MAVDILYFLISSIAILQTFLAILFTTGLIFRLNGGKKKVCIIVLGDIGRSPRMQYHANSFVLQNFKVNIVGFQGSKGIPSLQNNPNVSFTFLENSPKKPVWLPGVFYYVFKTIYQVLQLLILLIFVVEKPGHFLVQNPPAIPTLAVVWLICCLKGSQFIIDWHNYAFTILSLNIKSKRHPLVRFSKFYEGVFGRMSDKNICVTEAMKNDLETKWNITANVLYDKPPEFFKETELQEKHDLFKKLSKSDDCLAEIFHSIGRSTVFTLENENRKIQYKEKRPALIISSTSWTDDEDFSILLNSLEIYEKEKIKQVDLPNLICVITGKGPLKEYYMRLIKEKDFQFIKIATPWLETEDYPKLIGSGDLGICLHTSSSGLDLPMKVVDMFGCGLPVCAVKYPCLHELVKHDKTGLTFESSQELANQMIDLLKGFPNNGYKLQEFRRNLLEFQNKRWNDNWKSVMLPLIS